MWSLQIRGAWSTHVSEYYYGCCSKRDLTIPQVEKGTTQITTYYRRVQRLTGNTLLNIEMDAVVALSTYRNKWQRRTADS